MCDTLKFLTHDENVNYLEYVRNIKQNEIATKVKIEDLKHNSDLSRLDNVTTKDYERVTKYKQALEILTK